MPETRPNILLITSDQQHWNTLGCLNPEIQTPHLDALAAQGTLFNRAYCPNPTCTPTRASIITGKYPSQHGAWSLGTKLSGRRTYRRRRLHRRRLSDCPRRKKRIFNRSTGLRNSRLLNPIRSSKIWISGRSFNEPFYGFEHVELARNHADEAHVGQHYAIWMEENGCTNWRDYFAPPTGNARGQYRKWPIPEEYHYNTWIAERTNALMETYQQDGENFFLWASFFESTPEISCARAVGYDV